MFHAGGGGYSGAVLVGIRPWKFGKWAHTYIKFLRKCDSFTYQKVQFWSKFLPKFPDFELSQFGSNLGNFEKLSHSYYIFGILEWVIDKPGGTHVCCSIPHVKGDQLVSHPYFTCFPSCPIQGNVLFWKIYAQIKIQTLLKCLQCIMGRKLMFHGE